MAQPGQPLSPAGGGGPSASGPAAQQRLELGPGQLSRPEKVWSSSSTLIVGFYQAAPYSDLFKVCDTARPGGPGVRPMPLQSAQAAAAATAHTTPQSPIDAAER